LCVSLQGAAPSAPGPSYVLFPYREELVAVGLVGGVLPLLISALMVAVLTTAPRRGDLPSPFRSRAYWLAAVLISLFITLFFSASNVLYGGLGLPRLWAFWLVLAGGAAGADYWWLRGRRLPAFDGAAECYVLGTLGVFGSDVIRTLTGLASAPGEAAVWGGGGLLDILFWFGLYLVLAFLSVGAFRGLLSRAYETLVRGRP
jgi:hypothetical protein